MRGTWTGGLQSVMVLAAAMAMSCPAPLAAQKSAPDPLASSPAAAKRPASVAYLYPEQVTVPAGKSSPVELHFRIADGLHINSHAPLTADLIPTTLKLPETSGVRVASTSFPPGADFAFPAAPAERLSVYTGEFTIRLALTAASGEHLFEGALRYQACDKNACMPPRTIPVVFDVIAQ